MRSACQRPPAGYVRRAEKSYEALADHFDDDLLRTDRRRGFASLGATISAERAGSDRHEATPVTPGRYVQLPWATLPERNEPSVRRTRLITRSVLRTFADLVHVYRERAHRLWIVSPWLSWQDDNK